MENNPLKAPPQKEGGKKQKQERPGSTTSLEANQPAQKPASPAQQGREDNQETRKQGVASRGVGEGASPSKRVSVKTTDEKTLKPTSQPETFRQGKSAAAANKQSAPAQPGNQHEKQVQPAGKKPEAKEKEVPVRILEPSWQKDIYQKHGEPRAVPEKEIIRIRRLAQQRVQQPSNDQKLKISGNIKANRKLKRGKTQLPGDQQNLPQHQQKKGQNIKEDRPPVNRLNRSVFTIGELNQLRRGPLEARLVAIKSPGKNQPGESPKAELVNQPKPDLTDRLSQSIHSLRERAYQAVKNLLDSISRVTVSRGQIGPEHPQKDHRQVANRAANNVANQASAPLNPSVKRDAPRKQQAEINKVEQQVQQVRSGPVLAKVAMADRSASTLKEQTKESEDYQKILSQKFRVAYVDRARAAARVPGKMIRQEQMDFYQRQGGAQGVPQKIIDEQRGKASEQINPVQKVDRHQEKNQEKNGMKKSGEIDYQKAYENKVHEKKQKKSRADTGLRVDENRDMVRNLGENFSRNYHVLKKHGEFQTKKASQRQNHPEKSGPVKNYQQQVEAVHKRMGGRTHILEKAPKVTQTHKIQ